MFAAVMAAMQARLISGAVQRNKDDNKIEIPRQGNKDQEQVNKNKEQGQGTKVWTIAAAMIRARL